MSKRLVFMNKPASIVPKGDLSAQEGLIQEHRTLLRCIAYNINKVLRADNLTDQLKRLIPLRDDMYTFLDASMINLIDQGEKL